MISMIDYFLLMHFLRLVRCLLMRMTRRTAAPASCILHVALDICQVSDFWALWLLVVIILAHHDTRIQLLFTLLLLLLDLLEVLGLL